MRLAMLPLLLAAGATPAGDGGDLETLLATPVTAVSGREERLADAPATVFVIGAADIAQRGYGNLGELLADLPAFDLARPRGATWMKGYLRGQRTTIGDSWLVLRDGQPINHLYYDNTDVFSAQPLGDLERVEVLYGPASAVYGANAFMGVINLVTRAAPESGSEGAVELAGGGFGARAAEARFAATGAASWIRFSARLEDGEPDPAAHRRYEYTRDAYYGERRLWGGFVDNPALGGRFSSPHHFRSFDLRAGAGPLEAGLWRFDYDSGYGVEYAADRAQNRASWHRVQDGAFVRLARPLGERLRGSLLVRWRADGVRNDSYFLESLPAAATGRPEVDFSYWKSANEAWSAQADFTWDYRPRIHFSAGLSWERRDLQKAYEIARGPALDAVAADPATYPFPDPPAGGRIPNNRIDVRRNGAYLLAVWTPREGRQFNLGGRLDDDSRYGTVGTLRMGWVGRAGRWTSRVLFGQSYQEPNPRILYGGWTGSGSDPDLRPEYAQTLEGSVVWTGVRWQGLATLYRVTTRDALVNTAAGATNLGHREVIGADLWSEARLPLAGGAALRLWGGLGRYFRARERLVDPAGAALGEDRIGDLSNVRAHAGATWSRAAWSATLRGRYAGRRPTVASNPVRAIGGAATFDGALRWDAPDGRLGVAVRAGNLLDRELDEPGVRDADAGVTPGGFDAAGAWRGSGGFFNSVLPQDGRTWSIALRMGF